MCWIYKWIVEITFLGKICNQIKPPMYIYGEEENHWNQAEWDSALGLE